MELLEQPQAIILLVFMVIAALKYVLENVKGKNGDEERVERREQVLEGGEKEGRGRSMRTLTEI